MLLLITRTDTMRHWHYSETWVTVKIEEVRTVMDNLGCLYLGLLDNFLGAKDGNYPSNGYIVQGSTLEWSAKLYSKYI
jgi:hypothetical protein